MRVVTISLRGLVAFSAGLAVAIIAMFVFQAWRVDAAPGDLDRTFVPTQPCRLLDTRPVPDRVGPNGTLGPDDTRAVNIRGTQGSCRIPADAEGLSLNVTSIGATTLTFVTIWPGGARPLTSNLNPSPGAPPTPNAVTTDVSDTGTLNVYNSAGNVNLIIDVNGYYTSSTLTGLAAQVASANARIDQLESSKASTKTAVRDAVEITDATGAGLDSIVSLLSPAPVPGNVTIFAHIRLREDDEASTTRCAIRRPFLPISTSSNDVEVWQVATVPVTPVIGDLTVIHTEPVTAPFDPITLTYQLKCETLNGAVVTAEHAEMTLIFTPA